MVLDPKKSRRPRGLGPVRRLAARTSAGAGEDDTARCSEQPHHAAPENGQLRRGKLPNLTDKQVEVLAARARGEKWESIADRLHIVKKTAEGHLNAVATKMAWFLREAHLDLDASPGDIERVLGLAPGDLLDPNS